VRSVSRSSIDVRHRSSAVSTVCSGRCHTFDGAVRVAPRRHPAEAAGRGRPRWRTPLTARSALGVRLAPKPVRDILRDV
jgi:hypothetical protein